MLSPFFRYLEERSTTRWNGRITKAVGQLIESEGPYCSLGERCEIVDRAGRVYSGEVIGFRGSHVLSMPLGRPAGIRYGDRIVTWGSSRPSGWATTCWAG